jgi:hypothetical protein
MEFEEAISEHLELQRRNVRLEQSFPIERYRAELATRIQPRAGRPELSERTEDALPGGPGESEPERDRKGDSRLWEIPSLFDWGD